MIRLRFAAAALFVIVIASGSRARAQKPPENEPAGAAPAAAAPAEGAARIEQPAPDAQPTPDEQPALGDRPIDALRPLAQDANAAVRTLALLALAELQDGPTIRTAMADAQLPAEIRSALIDRLLDSISGALILRRLLDADQAAAEAKAAVLAKIAAHRDPIVRSLFDDMLTLADQRPQGPPAAMSAEEILQLKSDAARGERLFAQSGPAQSGLGQGGLAPSGAAHGFAAQCSACHAVRGAGGELGPDLSVIGHKFDRAALLESILAPSQSVAPAFVPYVLETTAGRIYAGYLVEKNDREVVLKDVKQEIIRVPAGEVASLAATSRSLMPDFKVSDGAAQDAADLLAYLSSLRNNEQPVTTFRILGPFDAKKLKLDKALEPEKTQQSIAAPDLSAGYQGVDGAALRWELAPTNNTLGFRAVDTAKYDAARKLRSTDVAHYFFVVAESPATQTVTVLLGAEGGCKLWLNGQLAHFHEGERGLAYAADKFTCRFKAGRNAILIKAQGGRAPGGVTLALRGQEPLELKTE